MHAGEVHTDVELVRLLVSEQFPAWGGSQVQPVSSAGSDNALYRLGDDLVVRLPRIESAAAQAAMEHRWLPSLAPLLPLPIPAPVARGEPGHGYPWQWSVCRWLEGENATAAGPTADPRRTTIRLAEFVAALQRVDPAEGPGPGEHNSYRGEPLAGRDEETRAAIVELAGAIDAEKATAAWEAALAAPEWAGPPVWLHGDLIPTNLLVHRGRLSAVIDFGLLGVGDPACDLMVAWAYLPASERTAFRELTHADDAAWARSRGWALSFGLIALPYYRTTNPVLAEVARRAIGEAIADCESTA